MADTKTVTSGISSSNFSASPMMAKSGGVVTDKRMTIPGDLVPFGAGKIVIRKVNTQGKADTYARTFSRLLISSNVTVPRETEDLETGEGANIPLIQSEAFNLEMVVNSYVPELHSLIGGKDATYGENIFPHSAEILIAESGTDPDFTYTYVFAAGKEPVSDANGDFGFVVSDFRGQSLQMITDVAAVLTAGQFRYNATTKTLEVSKDYKNENLDIVYNMTMQDVFASSAPDVITTPTFVIEMYSTMQSPSLGTKYDRYQRISRASISGDLPEPGNQKAPNTNMSYSFASQTPAIGEKAYMEKIVLAQ